MTRPAQPHDAIQAGECRPAPVERDFVVTRETEPAAVRTQTARSRLARRSERPPGARRVGTPRPSFPAIYTPGVRTKRSDSAAPLLIIIPVIDGAFPSDSSLVFRRGLYASR